MALYQIPVGQYGTGVFPEWPYGLRGSADLTRGLVAYLPLGQTAGGIDLVGSCHGTLTGGPVIRGTEIGSAIFLDDVDDYISLANPTTLSFAAPGSVAFWVRGPVDDGGAAFAVSSSAATNNTWGVQLGNGVSGTLTNELISVSRAVAGTTTFVLAYTTATRTELFDGRPHHIAVVSNGVSTLIYLDGRSRTVTVGFGADGGQFTNVSSVDNALIGAVNNVALGPRLFLAGNIWQLGVWSRALSSADVQKLYLANTRASHLWSGDHRVVFNVGPQVGYLLVKN